MSAMEAALGGPICLNKAGAALGWLNPNAISISISMIRFTPGKNHHHGYHGHGLLIPFIVAVADDGFISAPLG